MQNWLKQYRRLISSPSVWVVLLLGYSSGLPAALSSSTLQAWLTTAGVNIKDIGLFNLVALPYVWKFLWSPLMDRYVPPWLGRRRGWMILMQLALIIVIFSMSWMHPSKTLTLIAILALLMSFFSASQDIAIDAYRTDLLKPEERGLGAALAIGGWRLGAVFSGGLALVFAGDLGWHVTYMLMSAFMLIGLVGSIVGPKAEFEKSAPVSLMDAVWLPLKDFMMRPMALALLALVILYKFGDAFSLSLMTTFLVRGVGFHLATVGYIFKIFGAIATIVGAILGGFLIPRMGLFWSLLIFGILQAVTNLLFLLLIAVGKSVLLLSITICVDNLAGGMGTAAFLAFLMTLCNHHYTATQFALLSAISSVGRVILASSAGYIVAATNWSIFYWISFFVAFPGLILLVILKDKIKFESV